MKESNIAYQNGRAWVLENPQGQFEVYLDGFTHSVGVGEAYPSLDLAVARSDYIAKNWDINRQFNRLTKQLRESGNSDESIILQVEKFTTIRRG